MIDLTRFCPLPLYRTLIADNPRYRGQLTRDRAGNSERKGMSGKIKQRHKMELKRWEKEKKDRMKKAKKNKEKLAAIEEEERQMHERHKEELAPFETATDGSDANKQADEAAPVQAPQGMSKAQRRREAKMREEEAYAEAFKSGSEKGSRQQEIDALAERLAFVGLAVREVAPDGHCLYNSVSDQLNGEKNVSQLRAIAADHLLANESEFSPFMDDGVDFKQHCDTVRNTNEWGGHLEVTALASALNRCIIIYSADAPPLKVNENASPLAPVQITFNRHFIDTGEHYNSTQKLEPQ